MTEHLLLTNCGQLVTCRAAGPGPNVRDQLDDVGLIENGAMLVAGERIEWVGRSDEFRSAYPELQEVEPVDLGGRVVTPGLVDPHTHPVFAATREDEFFLRNAGRSYMEIAEAGGGIRNSARRLRQASSDELFANGVTYLDRMLAAGTTTIEAKSGYGLSTESEIKSLEVIDRLNREHAMDLVPTFLGAHEFPDEYRQDREGYIRLLIEEMIPLVAERKLAVFCDIFTEAGVYDIEQSRRVMTAAKEHGLKLKFHADELKSIGGAELAAELGAVSADHLVHISPEGIERMAETRSIAVLLPATTFFLGHKEYAPAARMIAAGVPISIATDFNPGSSFVTSLPLTMTIAAINQGMSAGQLLNAATYNAACSILRQEQIGSLEPGKLADLVIWDAQNYRQIPYSFGQNLVAGVYKRGKRVI
jgi:imidazolonepropionase